MTILENGCGENSHPRYFSSSSFGTHLAPILLVTDIDDTVGIAIQSALLSIYDSFPTTRR